MNDLALVRYTMAGLGVPFTKSDTRQCINCTYVKKRLFRNKYYCELVMGLNLDDGKYGCCFMYEKI